MTRRRTGTALTVVVLLGVVSAAILSTLRGESSSASVSAQAAPVKSEINAALYENYAVFRRPQTDADLRGFAAATDFGFEGTDLARSLRHLDGPRQDFGLKVSAIRLVADRYGFKVWAIGGERGLCVWTYRRPSGGGGCGGAGPSGLAGFENGHRVVGTTFGATVRTKPRRRMTAFLFPDGTSDVSCVDLTGSLRRSRSTTTRRYHASIQRPVFGGAPLTAAASRRGPLSTRA